MLGIREPEVYGNKSYQDLKKYLNDISKDTKVNIKIFQSNSEGRIITKIQKAYKKYDGIIINPGAYTHYSYAIYDALKTININTCEVHLSDINNREDFRKQSVIKPACKASFIGKGFGSYKEAIEYLIGV